MIIWLSGTFGAGKTTTAKAVTSLLPDSRLFDTGKAGAEQRRMDRLTDYGRALPWLRREAQVVDTTGVLPAEVATTVLRGARIG
ncbi:hypothetical protein ACFCWB_03260 [Streptomyces bacillaris]|uniref:hypothetical protein n=1 Tax=Streptomyces bacillaris TaxID=68179 RepID=UPI0035DBE38F